MFSGLLLLKMVILAFLGPQNWVLSVLHASDVDVMAWKYYQSILKICKNPFIYGLHQFMRVSGSLLQNICILDHFGPTKQGFVGPTRIRFWCGYMEILPKYSKYLQKPIHIWFALVKMCVPGSLLQNNCILGHFGPPKQGFLGPSCTRFWHGCM